MGKTEIEKVASEKRRNDVDEEDLDNGHAGKDHGVADVWSVGRREFVRVGEDRRIATGARTIPATSSYGMRKIRRGRQPDNAIKRKATTRGHVNRLSTDWRRQRGQRPQRPKE
jgi:hypothetical protein